MHESIDQPEAIRSGEQLDENGLAAYLDQHLSSLDKSKGGGRLSIEQFPSGYSNLTYLVRRGDQEFVLRRPPLGNEVRSAHDMSREFRVLSQLHKVYPLAPSPWLYCEDESILGAPFYLMTRCQGVILRGSKPPETLLKHPDQVRGLCHALIDNLVCLHQIDYRTAGLEDLGHPQGYVARQVSGWTKRYAKAKTEEWSSMDELMGWLAKHQPEESHIGLIHNDYKYDNLVLDPYDLTRIVGVLDWEMATIGDPLMDLGSTLAYWVEPTDSPAEIERAFGPTMLPGSLTRAELVDRYAETAQIELPEMAFYYVFGLFKLAVIVQQIYARYAVGKTRDPRFAELNQMVGALGQRGLQVVQSGNL